MWSDDVLRLNRLSSSLIGLMRSMCWLGLTHPSPLSKSITFYDETKGGAEVVDKLCSLYTVTRNPSRWPMIVFSSMPNVGGINSQFIHIGNGSQTERLQHFLRILGNELVTEHLQTQTLVCLLRYQAGSDK